MYLCICSFKQFCLPVQFLSAVAMYISVQYIDIKERVLISNCSDPEMLGSAT